MHTSKVSCRSTFMRDTFCRCCWKTIAFDCLCYAETRLHAQLRKSQRSPAGSALSIAACMCCRLLNVH
jgi:hypothetical protein